MAGWKLSYRDSCTPEIKPVIKVIREYCLRSPYIWWLSESIRPRSLSKRFSKVNKPDVFIIFIYPVVPESFLYQLFRQTGLQGLAVNTSEHFGLWCPKDIKELTLRQVR